MTNIYQEIHNDQIKQVEQLEMDYARYLKKYNEIKSNKVLRYIGRTGLRSVAIGFYILCPLLVLVIISHFDSWAPGFIKAVLQIPNNTPWYQVLFDLIFYSFIILWPAIAVGLCGFLLAKIRKRNKIIHSFSDLLEGVLASTGASIQNAKEKQKHFEMFAAEIVKKQMENK